MYSALQARTIYGDHERYLSVYMKPYPGYYFTGDGCKRDNDGYYWITGRVDDVLNVSGHRYEYVTILYMMYTITHQACTYAGADCTLS
jgi:acetyl-CoA synthetase